MINDLRMAEAAQAVYQMDHACYATSLNQLSNELPRLPKFQFEFASDGTNWSLSVPQQELFAGNYLLTPDHLYFNSVAAPSTNDPDLGTGNDLPARYSNLRSVHHVISGTYSPLEIFKLGWDQMSTPFATRSTKKEKNSCCERSITFLCPSTTFRRPSANRRIASDCPQITSPFGPPWTCSIPDFRCPSQNPRTSFRPPPRAISFHGMTIPEIARRCRCSVGTVCNRLKLFRR
jgi:hypothetical protein